MRDCVENILSQYGQSVSLVKKDGTRFARAFLQPAVKQEETVPAEMCGIGALDRRLWLYLGQEEVCPGEQVLWQQLCFRVRSSRAFYAGEELLYWWAMLEQEREAAE